jgi:hypothetical protein
MKIYSFFDLINEYIIEIPIIQRDYAQGREQENVSYIRQKFVTNLVSSVVNDEPMHLGFIYGKIEGKDKLENLKLHTEAVEKLLSTVKQYANQFSIDVDSTISAQQIILENTLRFIPLDGQQRLTTLFLLYWYINMRKGCGNSSWLSNFKYNNRKSALAFFVELSQESNVEKILSDIDKNKNINLKDQISKYTWYLSKWDYDATVNGALVMLDQIHTEFTKLSEFNFDIVVLDSLPFTFDFFDLDELNQSDELYIKMNERGKQLTDFEHFKAWLQDFTEKKYKSDEQKLFFKRFWTKIDTVWLDFFWQKLDVDYTGLDDLYFNYLKTMALNYHLATGEEKEIPEFLKNLVQDIRNTDSYDKQKVQYIPLIKFVHTIERENQDDILFELFSYEALRFIEQAFDTILELSENIELIDIVNELVGKPFTANAILNAYIKKDTFTLNLWDHVMYYSVLKYFHESESIEINHLEDWLRIIRNLVYNTYIQNPENLYTALNTIDNLFDDYFSDSDLLSDIVNLENFELRFFNQSQLKEEKVKGILLKNELWKVAINIVEKHSYFYGQINFILKLCQIDDKDIYDYERFENYSGILSLLFENDTEEFLLQRSLLSIGDYLIKVNSNYTFCKTETDSLRSRNENWRRVFGQDDKLKILELLITEIIKRKGLISDFNSILHDIIKSHNYEFNQWEYYFVESAYPLKQCKQMEIRWNSNEDVRLLPAKTIIGYHLELRSIFLLKFIYKKLASIEPFEKIEFLWDKGSAGHPGISMTGYKFKNKKYRLDIRYSFDKNVYDFYDFCFYQHADNIEKRLANQALVNNLDGYIYDDKFKHYYKQIHFTEIESEIKTLCEKLKITV